MIEHPTPDAIDNAKFGTTAPPCDKCPAIGHRKEIMLQAHTLAVLVVEMTAEPTPAGMVSDLERQARAKAKEILESK